ncbi:hypothetical protein [Parasitella parasitica]|uniref:SH3 domain-containing protein n=1 Tax=Parasitella parasitica TaxID=35722 RepID=A0A0B7NKS6_9FUNG|nr:hypothetical protein [Parasitella parasitica]
MLVKTAIAHHPYTKARDDEISFKKGEVIEITDSSDPDWWVGKNEDKSLGFFPSNFVNVQDDENVDDERSKSEQTNQDAIEDTEGVQTDEMDAAKPSDDATVDAEAQEQSPEEKKVDQVIGMARVMEDYASQEAGEISLARGGIINVYEVIDNEWSRGELNGKVGRYPSKYVEDIDMPGRPDLGRQTSVASAEGYKSTPSDEDGAARESKGGFKLAAYGVKQGGIGSLLAGGFPGLRKTPAGPKKTEPEPQKETTGEEPKPASTAETVSPTSFVPSVPAFTASEDRPESPQVEEKKEEKSLGKAIVLHPYDAANEDELSLLRGEYVEILDRNADDGWWKGKNERKESGVFPSNFVKELEVESFAPPTPNRSRRSVNTSSVSSTADSTPIMAKPPQVPRPSSVQTPSTTRPVSLNPRPSSVQASLLSSAPLATPPKAFTTPINQATSTPITEETEQAIKEEEQYDADEERPSSLLTKSEVEESPAFTPIVDKQELSVINTAEKEEEQTPSPILVEEEPITDQEEKESGVDETPFIREEDKPEHSTADANPANTVEEPASTSEDSDPISTNPTATKVPGENEQEEKDSVKFEEEAKDEFKETSKETSTDVFDQKPIVTEEGKESAAESIETRDESEDMASRQVEEDTVPVVVEEEKNEFDNIPSGPKLSAPTRARLGGRARKSPQTPHSEPSQMETLQKELETEENEEEIKKPVVPEKPAKPIKPIFAKFATPFAAEAADEISKRKLKPTATRRLWDETPVEDKTSSNAAANTEEEPAPVRPSGVKNIASRFNFNGSGHGGNEVLETKLRNHTKNEVEKVRKEFELLLQEEREKRTQLENTVAELIEKVKSLET